MSIDSKTMGAAAALVEPRLSAVEAKVDGITNPFQPIGRMDTVADLAYIEDPQVGWVYLVGLESDPNKPEYWYTAAGTWEYLGQQIVVDSTPTQGSNNPVSSGGVYNALPTVTNTGDVYIGSQLIRKVLTQAEYDLLDPPDPKVDYLIVPAST